MIFTPTYDYQTQINAILAKNNDNEDEITKIKVFLEANKEKFSLLCQKGIKNLNKEEKEFVLFFLENLKTFKENLNLKNSSEANQKQSNFEKENNNNANLLKSNFDFYKQVLSKLQQVENTALSNKEGLTTDNWEYFVEDYVWNHLEWHFRVWVTNTIGFTEWLIKLKEITGWAKWALAQFPPETGSKEIDAAIAIGYEAIAALDFVVDQTSKKFDDIKNNVLNISLTIMGRGNKYFDYLIEEFNTCHSKLVDYPWYKKISAVYWVVRLAVKGLRDYSKDEKTIAIKKCSDFNASSNDGWPERSF